MGDSLPTIDAPPDFRPPPPTRPSRIQPPPPPGPVPSQVRTSYDRPPHQVSSALVIRNPSSQVVVPHRQEQDRSQNQYRSGAQGQNQSQNQFQPNPNHHQKSNSPSTIFHIGPIPPIFTIDQIHIAIKSFNPRIALFDIKLGTIEIEIPYTLTWQQIGDCKSIFSLFSFLTFSFFRITSYASIEGRKVSRAELMQ